MKEFWHQNIIKKSFELLRQFKKQYQFTLIGGWAVFLYTHSLKSKDIDLIIDYETLFKLKEHFPVYKNERLRKYEIKAEETEIDLYLPHFSNPGLPAEVVENYLTSREGFKVPLPEVLLILKQKAHKERKNSPKGEKDKIDIFSLLSKIELDWKLYKKVLKENKAKYFQKELTNLLKETFEIKELGLNRKKLADLKKLILAQIKNNLDTS